MKKIIFLIFLQILPIIFAHSLIAQNKKSNNLFNYYEDTLKTISHEMLYGTFDFNKYEAVEKFFSTLINALEKKNSFNYPFDSLKTISILNSPDKHLRIFTWNILKTDGSFDYFGIIQLNPSKYSQENIFRLNNNADKNEKPVFDVLYPDNWYGAHYYKIIPSKINGTIYYTLLGWDGNNNITTKKIIDILSIENDMPAFGAPLFQTPEGLYNRFIIEYGAQVSVALNYEKQYLYNGKNKKWMIVFDRVSPLSPMLEGQYQFYVPETDTYDAFILDKDVWLLYEDVDARNPKEKKKLPQREKK